MQLCDSALIYAPDAELLEIVTMLDIEDIITAVVFGGVVIFCLRAFRSWLDKQDGFA
jgi:hypothetical protein